MSIKIIPALQDNYIYLIESQNGTICIDPGQAEPVFSALESDLMAIMLTHHHADHIDGVASLRALNPCQLIGPRDEKLADVTLIAKEKEALVVDGVDFKVLSVPGHTLTDLAYYAPALHAVFTGDALFTAGCGRLFEGSAEQMYHSLQKIAALPSSTLVYPGHEYTRSNLEFALTIEPNNKDMRHRLENGPYVPASIALEKKTNPFLRVDMENFARLREMKNHYQ